MLLQLLYNTDNCATIEDRPRMIMITRLNMKCWAPNMHLQYHHICAAGWYFCQVRTERERVVEKPGNPRRVWEIIGTIT